MSKQTTKRVRMTPRKAEVLENLRVGHQLIRSSLHPGMQHNRLVNPFGDLVVNPQTVDSLARDGLIRPAGVVYELSPAGRRLLEGRGQG
ncbi:MAG: hypothetical protein ACLFV3_12145 [Phycisphaeraceae bacterium]